MQNTLTDLNNHLFEQIERLNDDELTGEDLEREIKRSSAMANISNQIIANAKVELEATKVMLDNGYDVGTRLPVMLEYDKKSKVDREA